MKLHFIEVFVSFTFLIVFLIFDTWSINFNPNTDENRIGRMFKYIFVTGLILYFVHNFFIIPLLPH